MRYWTGPGAGQGLYTGSQNDQGGLVLQLLSFLTLAMETESGYKKTQIKQTPGFTVYKKVWPVCIEP